MSNKDRLILVSTNVIGCIEQNSALSKHFMLILYLKESEVANLKNANKHCFLGEIIGIPAVSRCSLDLIIDSRYSNVSRSILHHALINIALTT